MKNKLLIILTLIFLSTVLHSQDSTNKHRFPLWTFYDINTNIHGVSIGWITAWDSKRNTNTNGIKLEIIGAGFAAPLAGSSPICESDSAFNIMKNIRRSERINGLYLSGTGHACNGIVNGINVGFIGHHVYKVNGFTASTFVNYIQIQNGIMVSAFNQSFHASGAQIAAWGNGAFRLKGVQISFLGNYSEYMNGVQISIAYNGNHYMRGLQIGAYNKTSNSKGIQIGVWNVNEHRSLPIINWSF